MCASVTPNALIICIVFQHCEICLIKVKETVNMYFIMAEPGIIILRIFQASLQYFLLLHTR